MTDRRGLSVEINIILYRPKTRFTDSLQQLSPSINRTAATRDS
jgi:hypothetical protein